MARRTKGTNENWVRDENMDEYKRKALKCVDARNKYERGRKFEAIRVDSRTVKYVEIKE